MSSARRASPDETLERHVYGHGPFSVSYRRLSLRQANTRFYSQSTKTHNSWQGKYTEGLSVAAIYRKGNDHDGSPV
jgi:hypothetical protein